MEYKSYQSDSVALNPDSPFYLDHVTRYWWAAEKCSGKSVLDCACGKGYGTFILSQKAVKSLGIDLNEDSLKIARSTFGETAQLKYLKQDVFELNSQSLLADGQRY